MEVTVAYDFINHIIETNACPQLDQPYLLDSAGWEKQGFSSMYSSILEKWFSKEELQNLGEQQEKYKYAILDSTQLPGKVVVNHTKIKASRMSYSYLSFPLFNKTNEVCLFKAGYYVNGLAAGSAMYIFKKVNGGWNKVEIFGVSMS